MNVQQVILKLQSFWAEQNCFIMQPYDVEKGAGTMNPMTFLRSIGQSHGTPLTWSLHADHLMDDTEITQTACTSTINFKSL